MRNLKENEMLQYSGGVENTVGMSDCSLALVGIGLAYAGLWFASGPVGWVLAGVTMTMAIVDGTMNCR